MALRRPLVTVLVALVALAFGFLAAAQLRAELIVPGNRVARDQALVRTVTDLEKTNAASRLKVAGLRTEVSDLESAATRRSDADRQLAQEVQDLRAHAGLTPVHGPGVAVDLANGVPGPGIEGRTAYLINFEDIQDVVNLLFAGGAEAVAVNGHRITPASAFGGSGGAVVVDQSEPLGSPFRIAAVGNRNGMEQALAAPAALGGLRNRVRSYGVRLAITGSADLSLPASDASVEPTYARPA